MEIIPREDHPGMLAASRHRMRMQWRNRGGGTKPCHHDTYETPGILRQHAESGWSRTDTSGRAWVRKCAKCPSMVSVVHWKVAVGFVAQRIERLSPEQKVEGSNPFEPTKMKSLRPGRARGFSLYDSLSVILPGIMIRAFTGRNKRTICVTICVVNH